MRRAWTSIVTGAALVATAGLLVLAGGMNFRSLQEEAFRGAEHTAAALTEHALRAFRAQELVISFVDAYVSAMSWEQIRASRTLHTLLARVSADNEDISGIFLIDPEGRVALSSLAFPTPALDVSDRDYFRALGDADVLYVSERAIGRLTQEPFFNLARRRGSGAGGFDGLIAVSINPEYYEAFYRSFLGPMEVANLVRTDGVMLARHPALEEDRYRLPPDAPLMRALAEDDRAGRFAGRSFTDRVDRVVAYRRVGALPVVATFQAPTAAVWTRWQQVMIPYLLASLAALAGLLIAIRLAEQRARRSLAEERHRDAAEANRAKDVFIATVSHEIRNPLAAIAVAGELLRRGPGQAAKASEIIARQIAQVSALLDDLLDTARAVYGKLKLDRRRIDLLAAAREVVSDRAAGERRARIEVSGTPAWVNADPVRLRQMIENLVENAVRYGGRNIAVHVGEHEGCAELAVADDGEGIAPQLLQKLFEPFVQGEQARDRRRGGLGLGLALVSRLAQLHGGSVKAYSEGPGHGSTFTLRLPRVDPPARLVESGAAAAPPAQCRVLVIEDDPDEREALRTLLEDLGHQTHVAATGPEGLAAFAAAPPDVAIIDIGLPDIDGLELVRRIRTTPNGRECFLIAVSGYGSPRDVESSRQAGFDAHLAKPFAPAHLLRLFPPHCGRSGRAAV